MEFLRAEIYFLPLVGKSLTLKMSEIALKLRYDSVFDLARMMTVLKIGHSIWQTLAKLDTLICNPKVRFLIYFVVVRMIQT